MVLTVEYSLNLRFFAKHVPMEIAAHYAAKAGFTALDYTPPVKDDNWEEVLDHDLEIFAKEGLRVHQSHIPFNRYGAYGDKFPQCIERTFLAAKKSGAKYMVAHGDEFDFANLTYSKEAAIEYNYHLYAPLAEKAAGCGISLALENVFEDWDRPRFCANAEDLVDLINRFHSENVVCCWDSGHGNVSFKEKNEEKLRILAPYVRCTHIHDNFFHQDMHLTPFWGTLNWEACMHIIKEAGYNGVFNLEFSHGDIPEPLLEDTLALQYKTAAYIWSL